MKNALFRLITSTFGRRSVWRLSRALYMYARADSTNVITANGEALIQRHMLQACARNRVRPVVFDVGANIGDWTISLLRSHTALCLEITPEIHCFEPVPSSFSVLSQRVAPSRDSLRIVQKALSHRAGTATMAIVGALEGTNSLHDDGTRYNRITVQVGTVDEYCQKEGIPIVHYLKCDTEGHDAEVLCGAERLMNEGRIMTFQFEYNHRWVYSRHYLRDVFERVKGLPYRLGKITPIGIELYKEWHPELERFFEGNYAMIHHDALKWYPVADGMFDPSNTFCT
jgi:FkbM family methyltransferase